MGSKLIINISREENRVALIEGSDVVEIQIERAKDQSILGNVYKAKVIKVFPGMQAAFLDIGLEKAAFLYAGDVVDGSMLELIEEEIDSKEIAVNSKKRLIQDVLHEDDELMVQISRTPIGVKGPRVSTNIAIPARNLVLLPRTSNIGISRRIEDKDERNRLKELIEKSRPEEFGFIVRTAGQKKNLPKIKQDMKFLTKMWKDIDKLYNKVQAPALIYKDFDLVLRSIRDLLTEKIDQVIIDNRKKYTEILRFVKRFIPSMKDKLKLYTESEPIFEAYDVEMEINRALWRKVWLKSGGYIIIDRTEALTSIDVNTGRYVGKLDYEDTVFRTNMEAVKEIAYQLRLRNIGGLIVMDLIDMKNEDNKEKVLLALKEALKKDKAQTNVLDISDFGLIEMTRKRGYPSLSGILASFCKYCGGRGFMKSNTTISYEIFRALRKIKKRKTVKVVASQNLVDYILEEEAYNLAELEKELNIKINLKADARIHNDKFEII